jgi:hypothetical protein
MFCSRSRSATHSCMHAQHANAGTHAPAPRERIRIKFWAMPQLLVCQERVNQHRRRGLCQLPHVVRSSPTGTLPKAFVQNRDDQTFPPSVSCFIRLSFSKANWHMQNQFVLLTSTSHGQALRSTSFRVQMHVVVLWRNLRDVYSLWLPSWFWNFGRVIGLL